MIFLKQSLILPITDSGCGSIRVTANSIALNLEYEYYSEKDESDCVGTVKFNGMDSYRFRKEMLSAGFIRGSYDVIIEVLDSEWHREIMEKEPRKIGSSTRNKKHFAVFLSNNGYLEVIAESFEELPSRKGSLN